MPKAECHFLTSKYLCAKWKKSKNGTTFAHKIDGKWIKKGFAKNLLLQNVQKTGCDTMKISSNTGKNVEMYRMAYKKYCFLTKEVLW